MNLEHYTYTVIQDHLIELADSPAKSSLSQSIIFQQFQHSRDDPSIRQRYRVDAIN
jgi:hypothetical protein